MSLSGFGRSALVSAIAVLASTAAYASSTPHMISFGAVSIGRGQSARLNVSISNPDLMPDGSTVSATITFNIYELVDPGDRSGVSTLRFFGRQSAQVTLGAHDGAALDLVVPTGRSFVVSGVVISNPDLRTPTGVSAAFEIRSGGGTVLLNPGTLSDLVPAVIPE